MHNLKVSLVANRSICFQKLSKSMRAYILNELPADERFGLVGQGAAFETRGNFRKNGPDEPFPGLCMIEIYVLCGKLMMFLDLYGIVLNFFD